MEEDEQIKICDGSLECIGEQGELDTREFMNLVFKQNGIDLDVLDDEDHLPVFFTQVIKNEPSAYNKFNNILYKLNKENKVSIIESVAYLVEDWIEPNVAIKCLDEMNYYSLMNSLKNKYNLNSRTDLSEFFI